MPAAKPPPAKKNLGSGSIPMATARMSFANIGRSVFNAIRNLGSKVRDNIVNGFVKQAERAAERALKKINHRVATRTPAPAAHARRAPPEIGTVHFDVLCNNSTDRHPFTLTRTVPYEGNVDRAIDEELDRIRMNSDIESVEETDPPNRVVTVHRVNENAPDIRQRRARYAAAPLISGMENGTPVDGNGRCVFDLLISLYKDCDGTTKVCKNVRYLGLALSGRLKSKGETGYVKLTYNAWNKVLQDEEAQRTVDDLLESGVSHEHIRNFCRYCDVSCVLLDHDGSVVTDYIAPRTADRQKPVLVHYIANNHIYSIQDPDIVKSVVQRLPARVIPLNTYLMRQPEANEDKKPAKKRTVRTEHVYLDDVHNTTAFLAGTIANGGLPVALHGPQADARRVYPKYVKVRRDGKHAEVTSVTYCKDGDVWDRVCYVLNSNHSDAVLVSSRLADGVLSAKSMSTLSPIGILQQLMSKYLTNLVPSRPNPTAAKWFTAPGARHRAAHGSLCADFNEEQMKSLHRRGKAVYYDLKAAHAKAMWAPSEPWMVFTQNDTPQPYDGTPIPDLPLGMYLVKTDNIDTNRGSHIYSSAFVKFAHERGVKFEIVAMLVARMSSPRDALRPLLASIVAATPGEELASMRKTMRNSMFGLLGKMTVSKVENCAVTSDMDDIVNFWTRRDVWSGSEAHSPLLIDLPEINAQVFGTVSGGDLLEHHLPVSFQIADETQMNLIRMVEAKAGMPLYYATDAALVLDPRRRDAQPAPLEVRDCDLQLARSIVKDIDEDEVRSTIASWGMAKVSNLPSRLTEEFYRPAFPIDDQELVPRGPPVWKHREDLNDSSQWEEIWDAISQNKGAVIQGERGTGKSFLGKAIAAANPGKCVCTAPFAVAASHLRGMTIHSFAGARPGEAKIGRKKLLFDLEATDVLIVDEWSTINEETLRHVLRLKTMKPSLIVVILGDPDQIPGVEDRLLRCNSFDHPTTHHLVNGLRINLTVQHRSTDRVTEILNELKHNFASFKVTDHFDEDWQKCKRHIAKTNATRRYVNRLMSAKHCPDEGFVEVPPSNEDASQLLLYPGTPVIAIKKLERTNKDDDYAEFAEEMSSTNPQTRFRAKYVLYNQQRADIVEVNEETFTIHFPNQNDRMFERTKTFKLSSFRDQFDVAWCLTAHKAQGMTIWEHYALWDTELMDKEMLYTSLGRATQAEHIHIGRLSPEAQDECREIARATVWKDSIRAKLSAYGASDKASGRAVCDLTVNEVWDLIQDSEESCCISDCACTLRLSGKQQWTLDRLDNSGGHTRGNVRVMCLACNESHAHEN